MDILLTPPPTERWAPMPRRPILGRRPGERLRGLSQHVLMDLWRSGDIIVVVVNRPDSTRPVRLLDLKSLDAYLEKLAVRQALWKGVPMPEEAPAR
jgi:hypothetical protein